jgi:hypothetical protein
MAIHEDNLGSVLSEHELAAGLVVASDGSTLAQVGDATAAGCEWLLSALIGPYGDARTTFDSLDGQVLPRTWGQGDRFAVVDKPSPTLMVIVLGRGVSGLEQNRLAERVSATIRERWITSHCSGPGAQNGRSNS